jgi:hypothetical protein
MAQTLEFAPFNLKPGVTEQQVVEASDRIQAGFVAKQPGCLDRWLVREADGRYADIIWWASHEDAERAMAKVEQSETCAAYFALMQMETSEAHEGVRHFTAVRTYKAAG